MSDAGCDAVHDVSGDRFDDVDGDTWRCPHPATAGIHCPFHAEDRDADLGALLVESVEADDPARSRFIGGTFDALDLAYAVVEGGSNHPIDLREATFRQRFGLEDATVSGRANCRLASFESWMDLRETRFEGPSHFRNARFWKGVFGVGGTFEVAPDFLNATFDKVGNFREADFVGGANFGSVDAENSMSFEDATFEGPIDFQATQATGEVEADRKVFDGVGWFRGLVVGKDLKFPGADVGGDLQMEEVTVGGELVMTPESGAADVRVDATGSHVDGGVLSGPPASAWTYDLTDATIGNLLLDEPDAFEALHLDNTTFDGFDFGLPVHRESLSRSEWRLHDPTDPPSPAVLENVYLKAKNGAQRVGASKAAAEFFRKELAARRYQHRALAGDGDQDAGTRLRAVARWTANGALAVSSGYGERPSYVVGSSFLVISTFGAVYAGLFGGDLTLALAGEAFLFSFQSFIAFLIGGPPVPAVLPVQVTSALEGFVGAFLIALFVFTLTRSVHR